MNDKYRLPDGLIDWSHPDVPEELYEARAVPAETLGICNAGCSEYAVVPQECWDAFPASSRLMLALHFAYRTWKPDTPDGWYRLSSGLYTRARLTNRETRRRTVNYLQRAGLIDVRRSGTSTTLVRLVRPGPKKVTNRNT
ncbi:hypothetical protein [Ruegeria sp. HKCCD7318]|uniref:hypothetical protein n=1 Tax=Ruegeria sp. HKCCD7318 TaxID=2683014 RepID=UPI001490DC66|nr:hypothetical protein [Ruegeria sp. HKCCD7318]NOE36322.1 hypothetical protein [Ruegeria sp. HKCCD7318]